jgi:hypothetical protein
LEQQNASKYSPGSKEVAASLDSADGRQGLIDYQQVCYKNLGDLAKLTGRDLNRIQRGLLSTLITTDVHSRGRPHLLQPKERKKERNKKQIKSINQLLVVIHCCIFVSDSPSFCLWKKWHPYQENTSVEKGYVRKKPAPKV